MRKLKVPDPKNLLRNQISVLLNDHDFIATLQESMAAGKPVIVFMRELYLKELKQYIKRKERRGHRQGTT